MGLPDSAHVQISVAPGAFFMACLSEMYFQSGPLSTCVSDDCSSGDKITVKAVDTTVIFVKEFLMMNSHNTTQGNFQGQKSLLALPSALKKKKKNVPFIL